MKTLMRGPEVSLTKELCQVWLKEGEFLAVFFAIPGSPNKFAQVELRNSEQFGMEVFLDKGQGVVVKGFDDWHNADKEAP